MDRAGLRCRHELEHAYVMGDGKTSRDFGGCFLRCVDTSGYFVASEAGTLDSAFCGGGYYTLDDAYARSVDDARPRAHPHVLECYAAQGCWLQLYALDRRRIVLRPSRRFEERCTEFIYYHGPKHRAGAAGGRQ